MWVIWETLEKFRGDGSFLSVPVVLGADEDERFTGFEAFFAEGKLKYLLGGAI